MIKSIIFSLFILGLSLNATAQNTRKDNYFSDIKSIDLLVSLDGDFLFCKVRESDIRSAVGYTLANSPLKKIDNDSFDYLYIGVVVLNAQTERGASLGCSAAITVDLRRSINFKGSFNYVSVWSRAFLRLGSENSISRQINLVAESVTKEFVAKWAEQN
jgi:hypothetical protein